MAQLPYTTIDDHISLLSDKGYLEGNFGTPAKIGNWLQEFRERIEQAQYEAVTSQQNAHFPLMTTGTFNNQLERVTFTFGYQYNPRKATMALLTLQTRLGHTTWTHFLNGHKEPPTPDEVYENLVRRQGHKRSNKLIQRIQLEHDREKHPPYDPYLDMNHPRFNQVNDLNKDEEFPEHPPNDLTSFLSRPSRRKL